MPTATTNPSATPVDNEIPSVGSIVSKRFINVE